MGGDHPTPGPLDALDGEGGTVSKIDLLLGYVRGLVAQNKAVLIRLELGDRKLDDHARQIADLERKLGRKTKPEPTWWLRALAISLITTATGAVALFISKAVWVGVAKAAVAAAAGGGS